MKRRRLRCQALNVMLVVMSAAHIGKIVLVLFTVGWAGNGLATHVIDRAAHQMAQEASVVAQGRVLDVKSRRSAANPKRFVTHVRVQFERVLTHDKQTTLGAEETVVVPGGVIGRFAQKVSGSPRFEVGQEVILLLVRQQQTGLLMPMGLSMGRYVVDRATPNKPMVFSDRSGLRRVRPNGSGRWEKSTGPDVVRLPLEQLWEELKRGVAAR